MSGLRPKHIKGTSALDIITKAFLSNALDDLSEENKFILERITAVDSRLRTGNVVIKTKYDYDLAMEVEDFRFTRPYRKRELAEWQMAQFGVSLSQAYIDIEMAERFFLSSEKRSDREFARGIQIHWGEEAAALAQRDGDHRAAAMFFKEINKLKQVDKFEDDAPIVDRRPIKPVIVADPSELGFDLIEKPDSLVAKLRKEFKAGKSTAIQRMIDADEFDVQELEEEDDDSGSEL